MVNRDELLDEYLGARWPALRRSAYLLTGDVDRAEDLVQTALIRSFSRLGGLRDVEALDAYVRKTMVNAHINDGRRFWRREVVTSVPELPGAQVGSYDDVDILVRALRLLPARQRTAVVLRHYADLSEQETATAMAMPIGTVKSLTSRGLAALRLELAKEESR